MRKSIASWSGSKSVGSLMCADERAVDLLDRVVDDEVLVGEPLDHRLEARVAAGEVWEDGVVLEAVVLRDDGAVARAERAERPVVLAQRHVVERRAAVARGHRAVAHLDEDVAQVGELGAQHVVDVDQVAPDELAAPGVGRVRRRRRPVRARRLVPGRGVAEARAVVRGRRDVQARVLRFLRGAGGSPPRAARDQFAHGRARSPRERLDRGRVVAVRMNVPTPSSSASCVSCSIHPAAGPSKAGRFRSRRISDGSRPTLAAASSIAAFPAASCRRRRR